MPMKHAPAYTPQLYLPGSMGRYRTYPRMVTTPIPGAGFSNVGKLVWGEQVLDLSGRRGSYPGNYERVPLRGLGTVASPFGASVRVVPPITATRVECRRVPAPEGCYSCPDGFELRQLTPGMPPACVRPGQMTGGGGYAPPPSDPAAAQPKFFDVGKAIFASTPVQNIAAMGPMGQEALVSYAKITAFGTFIIAPLMGVAGYLIGRNSKKMQANRRRRSRR